MRYTILFNTITMQNVYLRDLPDEIIAFILLQATTTMSEILRLRF